MDCFTYAIAVAGRRQAPGDTRPPAAATHGAHGYRPARRSACARPPAAPPRSARPVAPAAEYPRGQITRLRGSPGAGLRIRPRTGLRHRRTTAHGATCHRVRVSQRSVRQARAVLRRSASTYVIRGPASALLALRRLRLGHRPLRRCCRECSAVERECSWVPHTTTV